VSRNRKPWITIFARVLTSAGYADGAKEGEVMLAADPELIQGDPQIEAEEWVRLADESASQQHFFGGKP
jgi:hypothetical protein